MPTVSMSAAGTKTNPMMSGRTRRSFTGRLAGVGRIYSPGAPGAPRVLPKNGGPARARGPAGPRLARGISQPPEQERRARLRVREKLEDVPAGPSPHRDRRGRRAVETPASGACAVIGPA